jgi:mRNA interferase RelE/StbE
MNVEFDKSFVKYLNRINDRSILARIETIINKIEDAESIELISNNKKLTGYSNYYRIKIGDYRLGYEKISTLTIRLIIIAHRKDIYNKFP